MLLAMDLNVVAVSAEAQELLSLIDDDHAGTNLPVAVYTVAAGTQRHPVRDFGAPAVTQHPSAHKGRRLGAAARFPAAKRVRR